MALVGIARAYHVDLPPYLSAYGLRLCRKLQRASIVRVLGAYPGLTWVQLASPQYGAVPCRAAAWLFARFSGSPLPRHCGHIAPGNSLASID